MTVQPPAGRSFFYLAGPRDGFFQADDGARFRPEIRGTWKSNYPQTTDGTGMLADIDPSLIRL